jgi:aspartate aminotransferase
MTALAAELVQQGKDVIGLSAGEPDFEIPKHIRETAIDAISSGDTKYTAVGGTLDLKETGVKKFRTEMDSNTSLIKYWYLVARSRFFITPVRLF